MGLSRVPQVLAVQGADNPLNEDERGALRPVADAVQRLTGNARPPGYVGEVRTSLEALAEFFDLHVPIVGHARLAVLGLSRPDLSDTFDTDMPDRFDRHPRSVLADNLAQCVKAWSEKNHKPHLPVRGFAHAHGLGDDKGTKAFQRAYDGENLTLDVLAFLAERLSGSGKMPAIDAWHLIHPDFIDAGAPTAEFSPHARLLAASFDRLPTSGAREHALAVAMEAFVRLAAGEPLAPAAAPAAPQTPPAPAPAPPYHAPTPAHPRKK